MNLQIERLSTLIEFCQHSIKLLHKAPISDITDHNNFTLYEDELNSIPSIKLNLCDSDDDNEIWLSIDRLYKTEPP